MLYKTVENAAGYLFPYLKVLKSVSSLDFDKCAHLKHMS